MNGRIYENTSGFVGADGNANYVSLVGVGEIIGQTITALGSVKDANLRRKYEQQIGELSRIEQEKLNRELLKAQNDSDRRKIFADVLSQLSKSRIEALNKPKENIAIYIVGGVAILTTIFLIYKKLKK
jgi:uncharacterized protein (DUF927 family)